MSTVRRTFSLLLVALCGPAIGCSGEPALVSVDAHDVKPRGGSVLHVSLPSESRDPERVAGPLTPGPAPHTANTSSRRARR